MVNNWNVLNLACSGATVQNGLLGAQVLGSGQVAPPQLVEAQRATHAKVIIVSVGADDVEWSIMTRLCVASAVCNDKVSERLLQQADRRLHPQLLRAARRPGRAARQPGRADQPVLLAVRPGPALPEPVRHHRGEGEGAGRPPRTAEHGAGARSPDVRFRGHGTRRSPVTSCAPPTPTCRGRATRRRCTRPRPASWPSHWPTSRSCRRSRAWSRRRPPRPASAQGSNDLAAVGGQGLLLLVVHQVQGELVHPGLGQLTQPVHVRGGRAEQAEPVHDLVRHEVHRRVVGLAVVRVVVPSRPLM